MWKPMNSFAGSVTMKAVRGNSVHDSGLTAATAAKVEKTKLIVIKETLRVGALNTYKSNCPASWGKMRENEKL